MQLNVPSQVNPGLVSNALYEVLSPNKGVGNATVRAETFQRLDRRPTCSKITSFLFSI